jgi:hypothetical protein
MTVTELIEILKTHNQNSVVVLADAAGEQGKPGVVQLRASEIQPVELYQVEHKGLSWYEFGDGDEPPAAGERTTVFDTKVKAVFLGEL